MKKPGASSAERRAGKRLSGVVMLFYASAFLLLALRDNAWQGYALAVGVPAMIWLGTNLLPHFFPADRLLLTLTNFLCALGILVLYRTQPELAYAQVIFYKEGFTYDVVSNDFDHNVILVTQVDKDNYYRNYVAAIK